jgi:hypothetical protein
VKIEIDVEIALAFELSFLASGDNCSFFNSFVRKGNWAALTKISRCAQKTTGSTMKSVQKTSKL